MNREAKLAKLKLTRNPKLIIYKRKMKKANPFLRIDLLVCRMCRMMFHCIE